MPLTIGDHTVAGAFFPQTISSASHPCNEIYVGKLVVDTVKFSTDASEMNTTTNSVAVNALIDHAFNSKTDYLASRFFASINVQTPLLTLTSGGGGGNIWEFVNDGSDANTFVLKYANSVVLKYTTSGTLDINNLTVTGGIDLPGGNVQTQINDALAYVASGNISFRATSPVTSVYTDNSAGGQVTLISLILDNVSGNRGGFQSGTAYDTSTGLFTAPYDGVYHFYGTVLFHTGSFNAGYLTTMITKPNLVTSNAHTTKLNSLLITQHGGNEAFDGNFPQMVQGAIQLTAGDEIGLYILGGTKVTPELSCFGGHLVHRT